MSNMDSDCHGLDQLVQSCMHHADKIPHCKFLVVLDSETAQWFMQEREYLMIARVLKQKVKDGNWRVEVWSRPILVNVHRFWVLRITRGNVKITMFARSRKWRSKFVKWLYK